MLAKQAVLSDRLGVGSTVALYQSRDSRDARTSIDGIRGLAKQCVCKKCGAKKQFAVDVFGWQNRNVVIGKTARLAAK